MNISSASPYFYLVFLELYCAFQHNNSFFIFGCPTLRRRLFFSGRLCECRWTESKHQREQAARKTRENGMTKHDCPHTTPQCNDTTGTQRYGDSPVSGCIINARR